MKKPTQHEKIIDMCKDGEFHCQTEFWNISKSPHKRRGEIAEDGKFYFIDRKCSHGLKGVLDYKMLLNEQKYKKVTYFVPSLGKTIESYELLK